MNLSAALISPPSAEILASRILIVDDLLANCELLRITFASQGFSQLREAQHGEEALALARDFRPDLVLLDLMMPGMDGLEVCSALSADADFGEPAIIIQTALVETEYKRRLFAAGATDYVTKPLDMGEVLARAVAHLEKRALSQSLNRHSVRIRGMLDEAVRIQRTILPGQEALAEMNARYGVDIAGYCRASEDMGGDCWGALPVDDDAFALYLADFSGHGLPAAFNTFRLHTMLHEERLPFTRPAALVAELNARLHALLPRGQFATLAYALIEPKAGRSTLVNAGAPQPVYVREGRARVSGLTGVPLAAARGGLTFSTESIRFSPGDALLLYSDGLVEQADTPEEMLDGDALGLALAAAHGDARTRLSAVIAAAEAALGKGPLADDRTAALCVFS